MADGPTRKEALEKVTIVIEEWIATAREIGKDIPEPKGRVQFG
jgi:predicted RNase H-like HicB family nuclease